MSYIHLSTFLFLPQLKSSTILRMHTNSWLFFFHFFPRLNGGKQGNHLTRERRSLKSFCHLISQKPNSRSYYPTGARQKQCTHTSSTIYRDFLLLSPSVYPIWPGSHLRYHIYKLEKWKSQGQQHKAPSFQMKKCIWNERGEKQNEMVIYLSRWPRNSTSNLFFFFCLFSDFHFVERSLSMILRLYTLE